MANYFSRTWNKFLGRTEQRSASTESSNLSNPSSWFRLMLGGGPTNAGVTVNQETILGISAVWSAIDILASSIAALPFKVYRKTTDGDREELEDHPVSILLKLMPLDFPLPFEFWYAMIANAILWGESSAQIIRNEDGRPVSMEMLLGRTESFKGTNGKWYYKNSQFSKAIPAEDVFHISGLLNTTCKRGRGIVAQFRETFGEGIAAQIFSQKFFANGAHLKGYLSHPQKVSDKAMENLRKTWKQRYEGMDNVGSTAILEEGMEFKPLTVSPKEAELTPTKKNIVEETARITRVPLHMLQALERATFNNIEFLGLDFVKYTLTPWLTKIKQEGTRKFFYAAEMATHYCEHTLNSLLQGDTKARAAFYKELFYMGALTPNQIRRLENWNGYDGGDRYYIQQNLIPSEKVDAHFDKMNSPKMQKNGDQKS